MKIHPLSEWRENIFETFDVTSAYPVANLDVGRKWVLAVVDILFGRSSK
jgi:hypothetical protein